MKEKKKKPGDLIIFRNNLRDGRLVRASFIKRIEDVEVGKDDNNFKYSRYYIGKEEYVLSFNCLPDDDPKVLDFKEKILAPVNFAFTSIDNFINTIELEPEHKKFLTELLYEKYR